MKQILCLILLLVVVFIVWYNNQKPYNIIQNTKIKINNFLKTTTKVKPKPKLNIVLVETKPEILSETTSTPDIIPNIIPKPNTICQIKTNSMGTLEITAYTACEEECDSTPNITASNQKVRLGICALSRDIEKKHKLKFGDKIFIPEHGTFEFQDRMNKRILKTVDIFMLTKTEARSFGRQTAEVFHDAGDDLNI